MALTAGGAIISQAGQAQQAQAAAGEASYRAQVARNNQQVASWNAQRALQQGQVAEDQQRQKTAQAIASQRAQMAGQGSDINSGSDVDLIGDTARSGEFKAQCIRNDAQDNAYKFELGANAAAGQASLADSQASNDLSSFNTSLLGSSLSGAGKNLMAPRGT